MKACETLIAWNDTDEDDPCPGDAPPGAIAVGPLLREGSSDWTRPYANTGGAAHVARRKLPADQEPLEVLKDFYILSYGYGLDPYVVHRAFLHIEEYVTLIKRMGWGPDKGERGHDPNIPYGRVAPRPTQVREWLGPGGAVHVWPPDLASCPPDPELARLMDECPPYDLASDGTLIEGVWAPPDGRAA